MLARTDRLDRLFLIRPARPSDAGAIGSLLAELAAAGDLILLSPDEVGLDEGPRRDEILRASANPDRWYLAVAEQDGEVVGMLDLRAVPLRKCRHVTELGIGLTAGARGRGIGTALMEHAIAHAGTMGCRKLRLFVIDGNQRAVHLYRKMGFRETGRYVAEVSVDDRLVDLIVMEKELT